MPYIHCLTSREIDPSAEENFKSGAAAALAEIAGKPENYLFVSLEAGKTLFLRGQRKPGAVLQVSLVGKLSGTQKKDLSARLGGLCQKSLGVEEGDVYIIFQEVAGENWGWNGGTFG